MKVQKFDNIYAVRLVPGEEIIKSIETVCEAEKINLATVSAIGAVNTATVGLYNLDEKKYHKNHFDCPLELVSLLGNVTRKDGNAYVHVHASFADSDGKVIGGHLNEAVISATCEMFITVIDGYVCRKTDEITGLQVFDI